MGFLKNKKAHLYRIKGVEDHVHILMSLHPTSALSEVMHDLKLATVAFIKEEKVFPDFVGWAEGYGAFTVGWRERAAVIEYIKGQVEHHATVSFREEYQEMLSRHGVEYEGGIWSEEAEFKSQLPRAPRLNSTRCSGMCRSSTPPGSGMVLGVARRCFASLRTYGYSC